MAQPTALCKPLYLQAGTLTQPCSHYQHERHCVGYRFMLLPFVPGFRVFAGWRDRHWWKVLSRTRGQAALGIGEQTPADHEQPTIRRVRRGTCCYQQQG